MIIDFNGGSGSGGGSCKLEHKDYNITENGTTPIVPSEGFDGIFEGDITVDVQPLLQEKTVEITGNGLTDITPDEGNYGLSKVRVNTNVQSTGSSLDITGTGWENGEPYFPVALNRTASLNDDIEYTKQKFAEWDPSGTSLAFGYMKGDKNLIYAPKIDTSKVTTMSYCFSNCSNLASIPQLDTSAVTNIGNMFEFCSKLSSIPLLDTSKVTKMQGCFGFCSSLTSVPQFDTRNVTDMKKMFNSCSSLTSVPQFDTSNVTNMESMFEYCSSLTTVPQFDTSNVTNMSYCFASCSNLTNLGGFIGLKVSLSLSSSKLTKQSLLNVIAGLATLTDSPTLYIGSTNLAKLTEEEIAVATAKGWIIE